MDREEFEKNFKNTHNPTSKADYQKFIAAYVAYHEAHNESKIHVIAMEEMAELQKELCKILRGNARNSSENYGLLEEMADVQLCLDSLKMYLGLTDFDVRCALDVKMQKCKEKMEKGKL